MTPVFTWLAASPSGRHGLAIVAVAVAALARVGLTSAGLDPRLTAFSPFYAAIVLAALTGGLPSGLVALTLSAVASLALATPRELLGPSTLPAFGIFLVVGSLIVWLAHLTHVARLRAERAEHRLQSTLDGITDSFVTVDFMWRFTYVNEAAQAYFGLRSGDVLGRNCWDVFPQAVGTPTEASLRQVMTRREPITIEIPAVLRAGHWAQLHVAPTADGISVVFRDVTEAYRLREASLRHQARLHMALEAARMTAWEYDPAHNRVTYSASAPEVLGIPADMLPVDRVAGEDMIHPADRTAHVACMRSAARSADGAFRSRYRLADPYLFGRPGPIWIEDRGRMIFDAVGNLTMVQGVLQDISPQMAIDARIHVLNQDLRERIAERQTLLEAAERSSRAKDDFLAVLSHELRSPMQSVLGWVQVLKDTPLHVEASTRALDTIERNLRQQSQLINDMLDVSRIVTGKLVFHLATLPLATIVRETVDTLGPQADAKAVSVHVAVDGDLLVVADRERLRQVVSNLVTNAVKFTPPGGAIQVTCRACDGRAQLDVQDSGDGIRSDRLATIFERFRQADTSSTRQHEGLGLGLSITKHIVDHLGGTIEAASDGPGLGSRFTVRLPLAVSRRVDDAVPPSAGRLDADTDMPASGRLTGLDLLVVDDHRDTVDLIAFVTRREGAIVRTALSATEALAAWHDRPARAVVTDLSMPGMDGFALLHAIGGADVVAIALSGLARADDRQRALQAGFATHLAKPVEPAVLIDTLARLTSTAAVP